MLTIKIVDRVRPCEPERPDGAPDDWKPRRRAGAPVGWHGGFTSIADLGTFSIHDGEGPWEAARTAFDWRPEHGFGRVHVADFNEDDKVGYCIIGDTPQQAEVFIASGEASLFILGPDGKTIDRIG